MLAGLKHMPADRCHSFGSMQLGDASALSLDQPVQPHQLPSEEQARLRWRSRRAANRTAAEGLLPKVQLKPWQLKWPHQELQQILERLTDDTFSVAMRRLCLWKAPQPAQQ
mmetsp:Transcript_87993/g.158646  ORF Transcript_87993/g.158646 Transcript_87993/m.158646 type:complete len:111 (-) Transcript_87993:23-355(-)